MGKLNEIQEQMTQSYGSNSFTTTIKDNTVEFDSAKDKFTFKDPVEVPSINVNGQESVAFTSEDRTKLDNLQTPMQIQGRVDSVADLANIENPKVGDVYLVGLSGSETFEEYVCTGFSGSPEVADWESVGTTQKQSDWNQNDNTKVDFIKNRICYDASTTQTYYTGNFGASGGTFTFESPYPFINGETYTFTIGSVVSNFIPQGSSDNVSGSCSISIPQGGASFSFSNSSQNCSVNISANPSEYANKDFTITKQNVNIIKIDNKFLTETKKVNIEQGKAYIDKFNNNSGWGDGGASNTDTINIIVTDDMLDGQAYTFEGVIKCNASASPQPTLKVKKNGASVSTLPSSLPAITKNYVIYKITYIYSSGVDIVFVWTNID